MSDTTQPLPKPTNPLPTPSIHYRNALRTLTIWMIAIGLAILVIAVAAGCQTERLYYDDGSEGEAIMTYNLTEMFAIARWSVPFFCLAVIGQMIRLATLSINEKVAEIIRARASAVK